MKTPAELWQEYRDAIYKGSIPEDQERETRQAFLSGMQTLLSELAQSALHHGENDDAATDDLDVFHKQLLDCSMKAMPTVGATQ